MPRQVMKKGFIVVVGMAVTSLLLSRFYPETWSWVLSLSILNPGNVYSDKEGLKAGMNAYAELELVAAERIFRECASTEPACQSFMAEVEYILAGKGLEGARSLISLADKGNSDAQYLLGVLYSSSLSYERNSSSLIYAYPKYSLGLLYLFAASTAGHVGALMSMGYRHFHGYGVPKRCDTAALNYIEVAKIVANIYSTGIPAAVELVRMSTLNGLVESEDDGERTASNNRLSLSEITLFEQIALSDRSIAHAVGKRYLLGLEGFEQDFAKAKYFLELSAAIHPSSMNYESAGNENILNTVDSSSGFGPAYSLLGYMHALGLGVDKDLEVAEKFFISGTQPHSNHSSDHHNAGDSLAFNGLGFIEFNKNQYHEAFNNFNTSAHKGSPDGMFNLASLYLSGLGTDQNFAKAFIWYSQALERGHTPAAYALGVMHLNGIGTSRDCGTAVKLFKEVAERGEWVNELLRLGSSSLSSSTDKGIVSLVSEGVNSLSNLLNVATNEVKKIGVAVLTYAKLAEAGHEISQQNIAHLLDLGKGGSSVGKELFFEGGAVPSTNVDEEEGLVVMMISKVMAQRYYELSADQSAGSMGGSLASEMRLGDYCYYGWGVEVDVLEGGEILVKSRAKPNYFEAADHYKRVLSIDGSVTDGASAGYAVALGRGIARAAAFNLGYMHEFGLGVSQNFDLAGKYYEKAFRGGSGGEEGEEGEEEGDEGSSGGGTGNKVGGLRATVLASTSTSTSSLVLWYFRVFLRIHRYLLENKIGLSSFDFLKSYFTMSMTILVILLSIRWWLGRRRMRWGRA